MTEDEAVLVEHTDAAEVERDNDNVPDLQPEDAIGKVDNNEPTKEERSKVEKKLEAEALQIVSIGTEDDQYAFTFHDDQLNLIISRIPPGWKVAVVSVVGAFRTGKSFLLSWFLKYLKYITTASAQEEAETSDDKPLLSPS